MLLHVLPLLDRWFAANVKKKDVHVLPTVLGQGSTHVRIQYKRWQGIEQAGGCASRTVLAYFF